MFHVRGSICLGSKILILKEMFARGNVNHKAEWVGRKRYNFTSPWHGLEKISCYNLSKKKDCKYMKSRETSKEDRMASGEVLASRVSSAKKFNTKD